MRTFLINNRCPLNYLVCGQLISKNDFIHMKRTLNENVLIFVQEGTLFIKAENQQYSISKNQYIVLKAGEEHYGVKKSPGHLNYFWVHFSDIIEVQNDKETSGKYLSFPESGIIQNPARVILLFRQLMDFSLEKNEFYNLKLNYSLSILMMEVSNSVNNKTAQKKNPLINDIENWIKLNFYKDFSIEEIAAEFKLQPNYISKIFKQNTGKSIIQFSTELKIIASKNLLQNFSVKETAYSCGFADEKYFMKVFKKYEGITPTEYKQAFSLRNVNQ